MTGGSVSAFVQIFNIAMLALGGRFALTTVVSIFAYPLALGLLDRVAPAGSFPEWSGSCTTLIPNAL